ncbi:MAG: hypothetical protein WDO70_06585 [Alphaproteobacteria bacterium]
MCKMLVRNNEEGTPIISINEMLRAEPLGLYFNHTTGEINLSMTDGKSFALGRIEKDQQSEWLTSMSEITIQSELAGLLAAGYRVGVHSAH